MARREKGRTYLPNGDSFSKITVIPKNWESIDADKKRKWSVTYRIYKKDGTVKQFNQCGHVNKGHTLADKQKQLKSI